MTPSGPKKPSPFSLCLTFEARAALEQDAADMPLGAYTRLAFAASLLLFLTCREKPGPPRTDGARSNRDCRRILHLAQREVRGRRRYVLVIEHLAHQEAFVISDVLHHDAHPVIPFARHRIAF
jgi:hypothetical protein